MLRDKQKRAALLGLLGFAGIAAAVAIVMFAGPAKRRLEVKILSASGGAALGVSVKFDAPAVAPTGGAVPPAVTAVPASQVAEIVPPVSAAAQPATGTLPGAVDAVLAVEVPEHAVQAVTQYAELPPTPDTPPVATAPEAPSQSPLLPGSPRSLFALPPLVPGQARSGGLTILQIGDSHTAADFFSGEVRQLLQARFGDGGIGYLNAGKPHPGVRSAVVKVNASPGWTYVALQKTSDTEQFYLSGFNASVSASGESLAFAASQSVPFDMIEVEAIFGPGRGGVSIAIDDLPPVVHALDGAQTEKRVFRVTPSRGALYDFRKMSITTTGGGAVTIASVGVFNHSYGVSYSAIGFPGATIDIANQINAKVFGEELHRIDPHIVVLAFGTNEGFNDNLDLTQYATRYRMVLKKIRDSLPQARIVIVGPPNGNRLPGRCKGAGPSASCKPPGSEDQGCFWSTPPMLDKVRELQRKLAAEMNVIFWNWGEITPGECGAHALVNASPRLMAPDHVHFNGDGYRLGARAFTKFLIPLVEQMRLGGDAVSNR